MKRTVWLGIVVLLAIGLWGCDDTETLEDGQYYLYYTNRNGDGLVKAAYTPQAAEDAGIATEMLEQLSKNTSEMEKKRSIPDSVSVEGVQIQNGIAEVTFGSTYSQMKRVEEVVCRSSVVLTLMQLGGVKGVEFYIDTEPLKEKNGQAVGVMTENTFTDTGVEIENQYASVNLTLYYANENGDFLKSYATTGYVKNNSSIERYVIEQLIKGPEAVGYSRTMSAETELLSVSTKDNICYVKFSEAFPQQNAGYNAAITIYSIVNSLSELSYISAVQISIDGNTDALYQDKISLQEVLRVDMSYVESTASSTAQTTEQIPEIIDETIQSNREQTTERRK